MSASSLDLVDFVTLRRIGGGGHCSFSVSDRRSVAGGGRRSARGAREEGRKEGPPPPSGAAAARRAECEITPSLPVLCYSAVQKNSRGVVRLSLSAQLRHGLSCLLSEPSSQVFLQEVINSQSRTNFFPPLCREVLE